MQIPIDVQAFSLIACSVEGITKLANMLNAKKGFLNALKYVFCFFFCTQFDLVKVPHQYFVVALQFSEVPGAAALKCPASQSII